MQADENAPPPLWTANLKPFSYASRPNPHYIGGKAYISGKFADIGVLFATSEEVICYFVTKIDAGQLALRGRLEAPDPFRLQLIAFDGKTGVPKYRKELPARFGSSSVMTNDEGKFVVRTGESLRLYGTDFTLLKERELATNGELDKWTLRVSPTGKTLLLDHYIPSVSRDEVLSSSSFSTLAVTQDGPLFPIFSISDRSVVKPDPQQKGILIRNFGGPWRTLSTANPFSCVSNPVFINDNQLVNACGRDVVFLTTDGEVVMRDAVDKKEHLEQLVSVTPDGKFVAVSAMQTKGGLLDYSRIKRSQTRILIYDTTLRKRISSVWVDPIPQKDYDFALAPDGSTLAVMVDDKLKVYTVQTRKR